MCWSRSRSAPNLRAFLSDRHLRWCSGKPAECPPSLSAATTFAVTLALIVFPFYIRGATGNMLLAFGAFYQRRDTMSAYAANIGWIINWALRSTMGFHEIGWRAYLAIVPRPLAISRFIELGYPNPRPIGTASVVAATAWAMWVTRRASDLAIAAALGAFYRPRLFRDERRRTREPSTVRDSAAGARCRAAASTASLDDRRQRHRHAEHQLSLRNQHRLGMGGAAHAHRSRRECRPGDRQRGDARLVRRNVGE